MPDQEKVIGSLQEAAAYFRSSFDAMYGTFACEKFREWTDAIEQAIALLKAQEPRVMTEQEMRDAEPGAVIYCEQRDEVRTYLTPLIKYGDGVFENRFLGAEPEATQLPNVRFWTSRPTDEQREAVKWE